MNVGGRVAKERIWGPVSFRFIENFYSTIFSKGGDRDVREKLG